MSVQMFSVSERRLQQQKALPMEKPEEAVDERAADESSLLHRNPDRHMREFLEAKVTGKGIRLLGGGITDEMVDLDG